MNHGHTERVTDQILKGKMRISYRIYMRLETVEWWTCPGQHRDWRDGLAFKSMYCSYRRPAFGSRAPLGDSPLLVTSALRHSIRSSDHHELNKNKLSVDVNESS